MLQTVKWIKSAWNQHRSDNLPIQSHTLEKGLAPSAKNLCSL